MPHHDDQIRLRHMLDASVKAVSFTNGLKRADLEQNEQLVLALIRLLEIIGEAAGHVSEKTQHKYPFFPWQPMAATRNRLIHGYFDVDLDIIWKIITRDLPHAIEQLKQMVL